jgi:type II secretory pathway pseudopilin PulG
LELILVMGLMVIVMSIAVASWIGLRRGAEMRGAVAGIQATLNLARQHAVTRRTPTIVVFRQTTTNSYYLVFAREGRANGQSRQILTDNSNPWVDPVTGQNNSLVGKYYCNRTDGSMGEAATNTGSSVTFKDPGLDITSATWKDGDRYAGQVNEITYLPPGVLFTNNVNLSVNGKNIRVPDRIVFLPDGTAEGVDQKKIYLISRSVAAEVADKQKLTVYSLTGLTEVKEWPVSELQ